MAADEKVERTDDEWRASLTPSQYRVLREHGTEPAWSHPLNQEQRDGRYYCAACGALLFTSDAKFESHCGWPSYYTAVEGAVESTEDLSHGMVRTEMHCRRCGGHLGHVFEDGPAPTGLRYCTNGTSLKFEPSDETGKR
jgi:peptide-methionine (R)-S-oxide reductase